ncbi:hypothetical protein D3C73_1069110 [compost metagenome]
MDNEERTAKIDGFQWMLVDTFHKSTYIKLNLIELSEKTLFTTSSLSHSHNPSTGFRTTLSLLADKSCLIKDYKEGSLWGFLFSPKGCPKGRLSLNRKTSCA